MDGVSVCVCVCVCVCCVYSTTRRGVWVVGTGDGRRGTESVPCGRCRKFGLVGLVGGITVPPVAKAQWKSLWKQQPPLPAGENIEAKTSMVHKQQQDLYRGSGTAGRNGRAWRANRRVRGLHREASVSSGVAVASSGCDAGVWLGVVLSLVTDTW